MHVHSSKHAINNLRIPLIVKVIIKSNPAARHYTGMSAAAERGMVTRIMRLYEEHGDLYIPRISGS